MRQLPIGSFLLNEEKNVKSDYLLIDGQQRATAIELGFNGPWSNEEISGESKGDFDLRFALWLDHDIQGL
jgi:hypothetical protein